MNSLSFKYILILAAFFILLSFCLPADAADEVVKAKALRVGLNDEGIRVVVDLSGKCTYQVRSIKDSSVIYIDLFDTRLADDFDVPNHRPDPMLKKVSASEYNFRMTTVKIQLKYGVPIDNIHVFDLKDPDRIVLDVYRDYHNFVQFYITRNILWMQTERAANGKFTLINELYVNHKSPDVRVDIELARNGGKKRETVSSMVKRTGAIAGVNGGYFGKGGQNLGLLVKDGKILASAVRYRPPRTAFGINFDREVLFNRVVDKKGKLVTLWGKPWKDIVVALGAGPRLISAGKLHITANQEGLGRSGNDITRRTGRTTLGLTKKGSLVLMTASGFRSNKKDGMKLKEIASYMLKRDVVDGMNLDGGGSTAMSIMGYPVSKPPMQGKYQRPVANALLIYDKSPIISPAYIGLDPEQVVMPADGSTTKTLRVLVTDKNENPVPDETAVSFASGAGIFERRNYYTKNGLVDVEMKSIRAPGNYSIKIDCGPVRKFLPLKLEYGEPKEILTSVIPLGKRVKTSGAKEKEKEKKKYFAPPESSKQFVKKFIIKALVRDEYLNPYRGKSVKFTLIRGKGSFSTQKSLTKANGIADTTLTLKSPTGKVKVEAKGLEPVTLKV